MLHKGMAVIIRNRDELELFVQAANKKGYDSLFFDVRHIENFPIRLSCNEDRPDFNCISRCSNIFYPLNPTITKVVEASDLFRNYLISIRKEKT